jgi:riboflavin kinase
MATTATAAVSPAELAALRALAVQGGLERPVETTCDALGERLDASGQTASRRLQALADAGLIERDLAGDGQRITVTDIGERALRREYETYQRIFADTGGVELAGTVTTGMGEGRHYITLSGYMQQFRERLGYEPFPGTLNIELRPASAQRRSALETLDPVPIDGWEDDERTYGPAVCYPATVETGGGEQYTGAHSIAPERTHHDDDQLELIAPDKLRDELTLEDGDEVIIHVLDE